MATDEEHTRLELLCFHFLIAYAYQELSVIHELADVEVRALDVVHAELGRHPLVVVSHAIDSSPWAMGPHLYQSSRRDMF
eukprot:3400517-Pyramimonas_sp.AAC.1